MKISKDALRYLTARANQPEQDPYHLVTTADAKVILEALGIKPRPTDALASFSWRSQTSCPVMEVATQDIRSILDYIKQLEESK